MILRITSCARTRTSLYWWTHRLWDKQFFKNIVLGFLCWESTTETVPGTIELRHTPWATPQPVSYASPSWASTLPRELRNTPWATPHPKSYATATPQELRHTPMNYATIHELRHTPRATLHPPGLRNTTNNIQYKYDGLSNWQHQCEKITLQVGTYEWVINLCSNMTRTCLKISSKMCRGRVSNTVKKNISLSILSAELPSRIW